MTTSISRRVRCGSLLAGIALLVISQTGAFASSPTRSVRHLSDDVPLAEMLLAKHDGDGGPCGGSGGGNGGVGQGGGTCATTTTTTIPVTTTTEGTTTTTMTEVTTTTRPNGATTTTRPPASTTTTSPPTTTTTSPPTTTTTATTIVAVSTGTGPSDGLGAIDTSTMSRGLAGAVELMNSREPAEKTPSAAPPATGGGILSAGIGRVLSPVLPPGVMHVVVSPVVILEALAKAFVSSGQALIIPGFAFIFGFGVPGVRRRVDDAIGAA